MFFQGDSLDDILHALYKQISTAGARLDASAGNCLELVGVLIELTNPRARLSRSEGKGKVFSALGELIWYLSGSDATAEITYYVPGYPIRPGDEVKIHGAYGPRIFGAGDDAQISNIVSLLTCRSNSRQAVVQLFRAADLALSNSRATSIGPAPEVPCTCSLQFLVRGNRLSLVVYMRSNDLYLGFPHDVFSFTMIQEIVAQRLGLELGFYKHCVGSLHLYSKHLQQVDAYLAEGWQQRQPMPPMPAEDPMSCVARLVSIAKALRIRETEDPDDNDLPQYWRDLVRLLRIYHCVVSLNYERAIGPVTAIRTQMHSRFYDVHIVDKLNLLKAHG